jgi:hypothetical protein
MVFETWLVLNLPSWMLCWSCKAVCLSHSSNGAWRQTTTFGIALGDRNALFLCTVCCSLHHSVQAPRESDLARCVVALCISRKYSLEGDYGRQLQHSRAADSSS